MSVYESVREALDDGWSPDEIESDVECALNDWEDDQDEES